MLNENKSNSLYHFFVSATIISLLIVVIAGSLVKATDSGMGCPDWPKCFGHLIPPTDANEVYWKGNSNYFEGQMVISDNKLWTANKAITSTTTFTKSNWTFFETHEYATYNPTHTIIEYINRLTSVLLGFFSLGMLLFAFRMKKNKTLHIGLCVATLILIGFEAWLGKKVVDTTLAPEKISVHLYADYFLFLITSVLLSYSKVKKKISANKKALTVISSTLIVLCIQLFFGTKLREIFDQFHTQGSLDRTYWVDGAGIQFLLHRSFSWLYLALIYVSYTYLKKVWGQHKLLKKAFLLFCVAVAMEIFTGIIMAYFEIPRFVQPMHVISSSLLLLTNSFLVIEYYRSTKS